MVNSAAHVIYDVQFEGELTLGPVRDTHLAVEMFEFQGHIYSVFAKDYKVIIYRDYQQMGSLEYTTDDAQLPDIRPLALVFDRSSHHLYLLARMKNSLKTFTIDVTKLEMKEKDSIPDIEGTNVVSRTYKHFLLYDPTLKNLYSLKASDLKSQRRRAEV